MLTRPTFSDSRVRIGDLELDPHGIARSAEQLAKHDLPELVRWADVPARIGTGMDAASDALRGAVEQLPGRPRRSPWLLWLPGLAIAGLLTVLALASWRMVRGAPPSKARELDLEFNQEALDQSAHATAAVAGARPLATAPGGSD